MSRNNTSSLSDRLRKTLFSHLSEASLRERENSRSLKRVLFLGRRVVPFLALGLLTALSWDELHALDWGIVRGTLRGVSVAQLLLLQLAGLAAVAGMLAYDIVLRRPMGVQMPTRQLLSLSWVANSFNNLAGLAGLTGSSIRFFGLTRWGTGGNTAGIYALILSLSLPVGLSVIADLALIAGPAALTSMGLPMRPAEVGLAMLALYLPAYWLTTGSGLLRRLGSAPPPSWRLRLQLVAVSSVDWLLAMGVLGLALWTVGAPVDPEALLIGFAAGAVAGILSLLPGGIGVFDATFMLVVTAKGVPAEQVGSALLLYRFVYFVVPWLAGVVLSTMILPSDPDSRWWRVTRNLTAGRATSLLRVPLRFVSRLSLRFLTWLTLFSGLVLLASAAFPPEEPRIDLLQKWAPLIAVESSHFLSVMVGVLLIALSRGIFSRVRQAYLLTLGLLMSGAFLSLLKGLDYEESILLLAVGFLLTTQRQAFFRNSFAILSRRNAIWLLAIVLALIAYVAVGLFIYSDVPYRASLWFHFAWDMDASRFLRSLLAFPLGLLAILAWTLFRLPQPPVQLPNVAELDRARAFLDRYGGTPFSHLVFMGDKHLFFSKDGRALIQFGLIGDRAVALGDPAGAPESLESAILEFREFADLYDLKPVFYEVSEERLGLYHDLGFALFKLGESARVDVTEFSLSGRQGESLRHSVNRVRREGARFELLNHPLDEATWKRLSDISESWLADKAVAEKRFSLGGFRRDYLTSSPIAVVKLEERIIAFANLMPAYGNGNTLSVDLMRHCAGVHGRRVMDLLIVELIDVARQQGYRYFDLGVAPLSGVGESRYARAQERVAHLAFRYGKRFYNYKGLRTFKEKFHPEWRSVYLAYPFRLRAARLLVDTAALVAGGYRAILFKGR